MAKESGLCREAHLCSSAKRRTRKLSIRNQPPQRKSTCTLAAHQAWRALAVLTETSTSPGTPQDSSACPDLDARPAGDSGRGADACSLGLGLREGSRKPGKEQPGSAAPQPGCGAALPRPALRWSSELHQPMMPGHGGHRAACRGRAVPRGRGET